MIIYYSWKHSSLKCGTSCDWIRDRNFDNESLGHWVPPDHLLLDSAPNVGPLISRWEINKFENYWYKSARILEVPKLLFQRFLKLSSSQRDMSGPILRALSKNRWLGGIRNLSYPLRSFRRSCESSYSSWRSSLICTIRRCALCSYTSMSVTS
jgi:hypothetical protein